MAETIDAETGELVPIGQTAFGSAALLDQLQRAAIRAPRPAPEKILERALAEVDVQPARAGGLYYALPFRRHLRDSTCNGSATDPCPVSWVEGPSVKASRMLVRLWHNCGVSSNVIEQDEDGATVRAVALDFETNSVLSIERTISRYERKTHLSEERWALKLAAGLAKVERTAALELLPDWLTQAIVQRAMTLAAAHGDIKTVTEMKSAFVRVGVDVTVLERALGHAIEQGRMTVDELQRLRGLYGGLARGEVDPNDVAAALGVERGAGAAPIPSAPPVTPPSAPTAPRTPSAPQPATRPQARVRSRSNTPSQRSAPMAAPSESEDPAAAPPSTPTATPPPEEPPPPEGEGEPSNEEQTSWL